MSDLPVWDDDLTPVLPPLSSTPVVIVDRAAYEQMEAELAKLRAELAQKDALIYQLTDIDMAVQEAEIERLRAEQRWEPLPNGYNHGRMGKFEIQVGLDSGALYVFNINQNRKCWRVELPEELRLCRRVAPVTEQEASDE